MLKNIMKLFKANKLLMAGGIITLILFIPTMIVQFVTTNLVLQIGLTIAFATVGCLTTIGSILYLTFND